MNYIKKIENLFEAIDNKNQDLLDSLDVDNADQVLGIDVEENYCQMLDDVYDEVEIGYFRKDASKVLKEMDPDFYTMGFKEHIHFMLEDHKDDLEDLGNYFDNSLFSELLSIYEDLENIQSNVEDIEEEIEEATCKLKDCEEDGDQDGVETYEDEIEDLKNQLKEWDQDLEEIEQKIKNV